MEGWPRMTLSDIAAKRGYDDKDMWHFLSYFITEQHPELIPQFDQFITDCLENDNRPTHCPYCDGKIAPADMEEEWCQHCGEGIDVEG